VKVAALFINKAKQLTIARELSSHGVEVIPVQSVATLLTLLRRSDVQAVLLEDVETELIDWLAMLEMRMAGAVPVIVVGGSVGIGMSEALQHGATDYVEYDGSAIQLLARLRARVGRRDKPARQTMEVGPYALCSLTSAVWRDGVEINLTAREFALAWVLFSNAGRVVSAASLSARVWGRSDDICKRTLEQHIYKLRRKLSVDSSRELLRINAVYSVGYRLDVLMQDVGWANSRRDADAFAPVTRPMPLSPARLQAVQGGWSRADEHHANAFEPTTMPADLDTPVSQEARSGPNSVWAS
jgi:DNA-binding response OmpR family regulator